MFILDVPELLPWMQKAMTTLGSERRRRCAMTSVDMKKRLVGVKFALQVLLFAEESARHTMSRSGLGDQAFLDVHRCSV